MLEHMLACAGQWRGTNMLQDPEMNLEAETTEATATITPLVDGRFVRIDYTWSYKGTPQSGSMLIGHQTQPGVVTMHWIDSWHNGEKVMACEGRGHDRAIDVRGSYAAPPGPDWGWRIQVEPSADAVAVRMHNVSPDGQESLAVEARYRRA